MPRLRSTHLCPLLVLVCIAFWLVRPAAAQELAHQDKVPLFEGLGGFGRQVTTASPEAQKYFDQGLAFLYAFNHDEAIRSFGQAAQLDPNCAMAWWGIALANGPHINNPIVTPDRAQAAWDALGKAQNLAAQAGGVERALIQSLASRYAQPQPEDRAPLDRAYADAMRYVWRAYPDDPDVGALFAESLMDLRPWDLWTENGQPQPGTDEVVSTLETVLAKSPDHPLALHLYIHATEASNDPHRAQDEADRLRELQPGLGHLVHMPSHVDIRLGHWARAIAANEKAIAADRQYRERSPNQGFYNIYMAHNHHMLAFAAIMTGRSERAIRAMNEMASRVPPEWIKENAALADGFTAMPLEVLVRFGRWDEVLAAPEPPEYLPLARALRLASRAIALAAKGDVARAKAEQAAFLEARKRVDPEAKFGNNKAHDLLDVAEDLMAGEVLYREGKRDEAFAALREAVEHEDNLAYDEPPDWIHPVRHALGALLLADGRSEEAEVVYRADLAKFPENGWALFGLAESLRRQGKTAEAAEVDQRFQKVWADADIQIRSSCYCQPSS